MTRFDGGRPCRGGRVDSPIRETLDAAQCLIDAPCELEGIELILQRPQLPQLLLIGLGAFGESLERRACEVVTATQARAHSALFSQLHRRQEQVLQ